MEKPLAKKNLFRKPDGYQARVRGLNDAVWFPIEEEDYLRFKDVSGEIEVRKLYAELCEDRQSGPLTIKEKVRMFESVIRRMNLVGKTDFSLTKAKLGEDARYSDAATEFVWMGFVMCEVLMKDEEASVHDILAKMSEVES